MLTLSSLQRCLNTAEAKQDTLCQQHKTAALAVKTANEDLLDSEAAAAFVQKVAEDTQKELAFSLCSLANTALEALFPGKYVFGMDFSIKRGSMDVETYLTTPDGYKLDCLSGVGGGVVDTLATALRLSCLQLEQAAPFVVLDEPLRYVSEDLQPIIAELLSTLAVELGFKFLMVSHDQELVPEGATVVNCSEL